MTKQYNSHHVNLGDLPDVTKAECVYAPYKDCGIWGNYYFGNEVFTRQMNFMGLTTPTNRATGINEVEVFRARNKLYNELM